MMPDHRSGNVDASPAGDSSSQSQLRVIGVRKKVLVKSSNPVQHLTPVHGGASIRPEHLFDAIVLTLVQLATSSSAVLAIRINQVAGFIDTFRILIYQDLRSCHSYFLTTFKSASQGSEPVWLRLCVIIQQGYQRGVGCREALIVRRAKTAVLFVSYKLQ